MSPWWVCPTISTRSGLQLSHEQPAGCAVGRGQLQALDSFVDARRRNFAYYQPHLGDLPGVAFMREVPWGRHTRWLTVHTARSEAASPTIFRAQCLDG